MSRFTRRPIVQPAETAFDIAEVQRDVEDALGGAVNRMAGEQDPYAPPRERTPVPEAAPIYRENVTAETIKAEFEKAAKQFEDMGKMMEEVVLQADHMKEKALAGIKFCNETAAAYREEATMVFERIENYTAMLAEIRETCENFRQRLHVNPVPVKA
jgi:Asp-tRNA(Asn)/Glu-tRNA(Gln) amidotransferase A subunit family amidase